MAEELQSLVVSLGLDATSFDTQIAATAKKIKAAEAEMRASAAEAQAMGKGMDAAAVRAKYLEQAVSAQGAVVAAWKKRLDDAQASLEKSKKKQAEFADKVKAAEQAHKDAAAAYGKESEQAKQAESALDGLNKQHREAAQQAVAAENAVSRVTTGWAKAKEKQTELRQQLESATKEMGKQRSAAYQLGEALEKTAKRTGELGKAQAGAGKTLSAAITAPITAAATVALKSSIDFESAFAGVRKTVDATEEEYRQLATAIREAATEIPASADALAEVMEAAGQLGIRKESLMSFTRAMVDLGESTNLSATEGATQLARFANITRMSQQDFDRLGSVIVALGNNTATTEAEIVSMAMRLASAGTQIGLTQDQIMAFSAALSSVGIEAEAGGSAFSKVFVQMQLATETGKDGLADFARVAGMSAKEFQAAFQADAAGAIQAFIVGLSRMDEQGVSAIKTLDDMGVSEVRLRNALLSATNAAELFTDTQNIAGKAWAENTALAKEAGTRYATTESRIKILRNRAAEAARTFGNDLSPAFGKALDKASGLIEGFTKMDEGTRRNILQWGALAAAIGPGVMVIGKANQGIGALGEGIAGLAKRTGEAGGGVKGLMKTLGGSLGPAGWIALAAGGIALAASLYDVASGAKAARAATESLIKTAKEWKDAQAGTIFDGGSDPFERLRVDRSAFGGAAQMAKKDLDALAKLDKEYAQLIAKKQRGEAEQQKNAQGALELDEERAALRRELDGLLGKQERRPLAEAETARIKELQKLLPALDKQYDALRKKSQKDALTPKEQGKLDDIIVRRVQLRMEYALEDDGGFDRIITNMRAEIERLAQVGLKPGSDLFGDTLKGLAQGSAAEMKTLDDWYTAQYADIMNIVDATKQENALAELNAQYKDRQAEAVSRYAEALGQVSAKALETPEAQKGAEEFEKLLGLVDQYTKTPVDDRKDLLKSINDATKGMSEADIASYLATLTQLQEARDKLLASGKTEEQAEKMGLPDVSDKLKDYESLSNWLTKIASGDDEKNLEGLKGMAEALGAEIDRLSEDLGIKTMVTVTEFVIDPGAVIPAPKQAVEALIGGYKEALAEGYVMPSPEVEALIKKYNEDPKAVTLSELSPAIDAFVKSYLENPDADTRKLKPLVDALVEGYRDITDQEEKEKLAPTINALVNTFGLTESGEASKGELLAALTAYIVEYKEAEGAKLPEPTVKVKFEYNEPAWNDAKSKLNSNGSILPNWLSPTLADTISAINSSAEKGMGTGFGASTAAWDAMEKLANLKPDDLANIAQYITSALAALNSGELSEADAMAVQAQLDAMLALAQNADEYLGVGNAVSEGIAAGLNGYEGWDTAAQTLASDIVTALNTAASINSPAGITKPVGANLAAGVGEGMAGYSFAAYARKMVANAKTAIDKAAGIASPAEFFMPSGGFMSAGVGAGMRRHDFSRDARETVTGLRREIDAELARVSALDGQIALKSWKMGSRGWNAGEAPRPASTTNNNQRSVVQHLTIISPEPVSPAEAGRQSENGLRRAAMGF